jgi:short subunit dehydrogenase-like uncharacterized protein
VRELIARYHERASADGTRVIPCCGFDSVPSDLGAFLLARHIAQAHGIACSQVRAYFQMFGGFNGGTMATLLNMIERGHVGSSDDLLPVRYDSDIGAWTGPFFMAPTNAWVVRRSAALFAEWGEAYGHDFSYHEVLKYDGAFARAKAIAGTAAIGMFFASLRSPLTRRFVEPLLPKPGAGPSTRAMDNGWFTCDLLGWSEEGRRDRGLIRHQGDPGNRATVRLLCESAFCLAVEQDNLPGAPRRGGVLTPATGLGSVLADRLRRSGMTIDVPAVTSTARDSRDRVP